MRRLYMRYSLGLCFLGQGLASGALIHIYIYI
jgi:hypothetical protein